jgi:hypothetical protein
MSTMCYSSAILTSPCVRSAKTSSCTPLSRCQQYFNTPEEVPKLSTCEASATTAYSTTKTPSTTSNKQSTCTTQTADGANLPLRKTAPQRRSQPRSLPTCLSSETPWPASSTSRTPTTRTISLSLRTRPLEPARMSIY